MNNENIEMFKMQEQDALTFNDYESLANDIAEYGNLEWSRNLFSQAENLAQDALQFISLAYYVISLFDDKQWGKKLLEIAENKADSYYEYKSLSKVIINILGDKDWGLKLVAYREKNYEYPPAMSVSVRVILQDKSNKLSIEIFKDEIDWNNGFDDLPDDEKFNLKVNDYIQNFIDDYNEYDGVKWEIVFIDMCSFTINDFMKNLGKK